MSRYWNYTYVTSGYRRLSSTAPTSTAAALARRGTGGAELPLARTAHATTGELSWETTPCLRPRSARARAPPMAVLADMDCYALWVWSLAALTATLGSRRH
jgi:hypothetical protein